MWGWRVDRHYTWVRFCGDAAGGLIAALIALPYGLAMALLMGLPPLYGVLTSIMAAPICALLGRNPVLIGGTSSVTVPFIASATHAQGVAGAAKVCICAAIIMMGFCIVRLGRHVSRVPNPVVAGFSCGIGAMMIITQLKTAFALSSPAGGWDKAMFGQLLQVLARLGEAQARPALLALIVIIGAAAAIRLLPRGPAPLFGVVAAVAVARIFGISTKEIGSLPFEDFSFAAFNWEPADVWNVLPNAFGLAFVASANTLITSRVVTHFRGRRQLKKHDADLELGAYGMANLALGSFGIPTCVGIPARSLANVQCGGTTRVSNLLHGVFLTMFVSVGAGLIRMIPVAALAGATMFVGARLLQWSTWRRLLKMRRVDAIAFSITAVSVLLVNAVAAVAVGCSCYLGNYMWRLVAGHDSREAEDIVATYK